MRIEEFFPEVLDNLFDGLYIVDTERKIRYWNRAAEEISGYSREEMEGRFCHDNILRHMDEKGTLLCLNGCPLHAAMADGEPKKADVFLHHKEGHRVPIQVRITPLRDGAGKVIGAVEIFSEDFYRLHSEQRIRELENKALRDPLTGLFNRYFGGDKIEGFLREYRKIGTSFGIIFLDVDDFKRINDGMGHAAGDEVLKTLARTLEANIRFRDAAVRWGGEEFVLVLHEARAESVGGLAEKFLHLIRNSAVPWEGGDLSFTVSAGATVVRPGDTAASIVDRADRLMYASKVAGKDRNTLG